MTGCPRRRPVMGLLVLVAAVFSLVVCASALADVAVTDPGTGTSTTPADQAPTAADPVSTDPTSPQDPGSAPSDPSTSGSTTTPDAMAPPPDPAPEPPPADPAPQPEATVDVAPPADPAPPPADPAVSEAPADPVSDTSLQSLVDALSPLVDSLQSVNGSLDSISPADAPAGSPLATLVTSLGSLADTLNSLVTTLAPLAKAGASVNSTLQPIVTALHPLIDAVNQALKPLIIAMQPLVQAVAGPLTSALRPLVDALKPLVGSLVPLVSGLAAPLVAALQGSTQPGDLFYALTPQSAPPAAPAGVVGSYASAQRLAAAAGTGLLANGVLDSARSGVSRAHGGTPPRASAPTSRHALGSTMAKRSRAASSISPAHAPRDPSESPSPGPALPSVAGSSAFGSAVTLMAGALAVLLFGLAWTRQEWARRIHGLPASWRPAPFLSLLEQPG